MDTKKAINKNLKILDAGCGTGLVGMQLKKFGYLYIDGVDFSQNMLDLVPKDIYRSLNRIDLNKKLFIKDNLISISLNIQDWYFDILNAKNHEYYIVSNCKTSADPGLLGTKKPYPTT